MLKPRCGLPGWSQFVTTFPTVTRFPRATNRLPDDFMFKLTQKESGDLKCQFGISNKGRGGRRNLPFAFTEHGAL